MNIKRQLDSIESMIGKSRGTNPFVMGTHELSLTLGWATMLPKYRAPSQYTVMDVATGESFSPEPDSEWIALIDEYKETPQYKRAMTVLRFTVVRQDPTTFHKG